LLGAVGAGKGTVADLLYGLRSPQAGLLTIDGFDYRDLALQSLREHVALVRGEGIFSGTLLENIALDREEVALEDVQDALEKVELLEAVRALPDGLSTQVSARGRPLSPGQVRRLLIARAIAGRPRLLVLDRIVDHLGDADMRARICARLLEPGVAWTVVCLTDDDRVARFFGRSCVLRDGRIVDLPLSEPARSVPDTAGDRHD